MEVWRRKLLCAHLQSVSVKPEVGELVEVSWGGASPLWAAALPESFSLYWLLLASILWF